jgi:hypothetical protein
MKRACSPYEGGVFQRLDEGTWQREKVTNDLKRIAFVLLERRFSAVATIQMHRSLNCSLDTELPQ